MVEMAKANGVNVYHYLTYLLEKLPNDRMSDEELDRLAHGTKKSKLKSNVVQTTQINNQSYVNCQGTPAAKMQPGIFISMSKI